MSTHYYYATDGDGYTLQIGRDENNSVFVECAKESDADGVAFYPSAKMCKELAEKFASLAIEMGAL